MLPEENRLKGKLNFEEVKDKGDMFQSENFGMLVLKREEDKPTKFGFVVSTKISKKAVDRNKIKRMLRDAVRKNLDKVNQGFDVLFLARKGLLEADREKTNKEVKESLKEAKII